MIDLDIRTVTLLCAISYVICTVFVVQLWRQNRDRFDGMGFWAINFVFQTVALGLIVSRGAIPDWMSIVIANILMLAGALLIYIGLEKFLRKPGPQWHNLVLLVAGSLGMAIFFLVHPGLAERSLVNSVFLLIICLQCLWLLWGRVEPALRRLTFGTGLVFAGYGLLSMVRIVGYFVAAPDGNDYFQSGNFQALVMVAYSTLVVLLTYSLILMVNSRLIAEIATQHDMFTGAFHMAPYVITLARLYDGKIVDVNPKFDAITGYTRAEVMGKSTGDFPIWEHEEDRAALTDALAKHGKFEARELNFRRKSGDLVAGIFSADIILADGEKHVLSCFLDITARKQAEARSEASALQLARAQAEALEAQQQGRLAALNLMEDAVAARSRAEAALAALRVSDERFQLAMEASQDGLWEWNIQTDEEYLSPRWREIVGYPGDDQPDLSPTFESWAERIHSDDRERVLAALAGHLENGARYDVEYRHRHSSGEYRWQRSRGLAIRDESGTPTKMVGTIADITAHKRAEAKLAERLDELRRWQQATLGREGRILDVKQEVNALLAEQDRPPRYPSATDAETNGDSQAPPLTGMRRVENTA